MIGGARSPVPSAKAIWATFLTPLCGCRCHRAADLAASGPLRFIASITSGAVIVPVRPRDCGNLKVKGARVSQRGGGGSLFIGAIANP
jgi:hypothetical protein